LGTASYGFEQVTHELGVIQTLPDWAVYCALWTDSLVL
jgi:hypothetical protein